MPKSSRQKLKILYLAKYLIEHTDEENPVSVQQLIAMLAQNDISAERKSIYSDLEELEQFGLDICCTMEKNSPCNKCCWENWTDSYKKYKEH